jgi:squalene-hopene/tetraprenyl-beta-curcumene cyclase
MGGHCCKRLCVLSLLAAPALAITDDDPPPHPNIYEPPTAPLDERIQPDRISETDPPPLPPLPHLIVLPKPPAFRVAEQPEDVPISGDHWRKANEAIRRGVRFLLDRQDEFGGWMTPVHAIPTDQPAMPSPIAVAVTALAVKALVQHDGELLRAPQVQLALRYIRMTQREDGSFEGGALTNYVTSSVVMALATLQDPDYDDHIRDAVQWLQVHQWDQSEGVKPEHDWFGGAGYGRHGRPDLSNTQMMLDALYEAGLSPDEPAFQRALAFVSRAQNLSATNPSEWAAPPHGSNDGGFIYTPAGGGESFASEAAGEGLRGELIPAGQPRSLRSYGSMTYAGFKSMMYAGLSQDDVRVRAAFDWIRRHFTFDENPGLGQQGIYYYYHTMARSLRLAQQHVITDHDGEEHNWRESLIDAIAARQREDGSWSNPADRWLEGEEVMATVYSLLSLQEAIKPVTIVE